MTQEAEALGMIVAELREIRLALTAPQESGDAGELEAAADFPTYARLRVAHDDLHAAWQGALARAKRAEARGRELTADNLHLCHKVATLETKLADVEAELKLERYRKSEQIRDKHRILDEYEVKVQALEAKLAAVRACPRGTLAGYEVIRADALDRALATGDNASTPPDHAAEEVK